MLIAMITEGIIMRLCELHRSQSERNVGFKLMEQVEEMKYLGAMISGDGSVDREVELTIGVAARMFGAMGSSV